MGYGLGVDLGTTYSAAAILRQGAAEMVALGYRATVVPSAVFLTADGEFLVGDAALRRGASDPERLVREFKRRIGDSVPLMVGGSPLSAEAVSARLLRWIVDLVAEQVGEPPEQVGLTYPANWGPFKQDRLAQIVRLAELSHQVVTVTEPEAAAVAYASAERVEPGEVVAVYDLGGGTFDAAVLRRTPDGFEMLGAAEGIEHLGGVDIDQAVFGHVERSLGGVLDDVPEDDPVTARALARLRQDCVEAKEALSSDSDVSIPVVLPQVSTEVRLTRGELESMVRPLLEDTVGALRRSIASAGLTAADVDRVLLVGGSSRIPLIAQLVSETLGRPYSVDAHPKHVVALGAAMATRPAVSPVPAPETAVPAAISGAGTTEVVVHDVDDAEQARWDRPPPDGAWRQRRRRRLITGAGAAIAVVALVLGVRALADSGGDAERPELTGPTVVLGDSIPVGSGPDGLALADGELWVTSTFAARDGAADLSRIDPTAGTVQSAFAVGGEPIGVVVADGSVWVARRAADQVARIDPATGQELATIAAAGRPHDLAFGAGAVWAASADGLLTRIDPADNTAQVVRNDLVDLSSVVATDDRIWVAYGTSPGTVAALDPATGETLDDVSIPGDVDETVLADSGLWVTRRDGNTVHRIDPGTLEIRDVEVGVAPAGLAAVGDHIWVTNNEAGSLTLVDGTTLEVLSNLAVGDKPLGVVATADRVWVALSGAGAVAVVDVSEGE